MRMPPMRPTSRTLSQRHLSRRHLLQSGALLSLAACGRPVAAPEASEPLRVPGVDRPNMVVFLADTLRADRLGCYGYNKPISPSIDALAAQSIRYETCISQASWTKPAMGSLWTGLPADVHQAIVSSGDVPRDALVDQVHTLRPQFPTLAEMLSAAGYSTALLLSNPQIQKQYGYGGGFDHYDYRYMYDPHEQMTEAIAWLRREAVEPWFLFVHEIDPHGPYIPDPEDFEMLFGASMQELRAPLSPEDQRLLALFDLWHEKYLDDPIPQPNMYDLSRDGIDYMEKLYLAEIPRVDRQVGRLVEALEEDGLRDRTVVVVTSDHGEAFYEHGTLQHGMSLHHEELHVPLTISGPGITPGVEQRNVAFSDLYFTLLGLAGAPAQPNPWHGPLPGIPGQTPPGADRVIHAMTNRFLRERDEWQYAMYHKHMKVIETKDGRVVFDRDYDPGEHTNVLDTEWADAPPAREVLARYDAERAALAAAAEEYGPEEWTDLPDEERERLEAMGYV